MAGEFFGFLAVLGEHGRNAYTFVKVNPAIRNLMPSTYLSKKEGLTERESEEGEKRETEEGEERESERNWIIKLWLVFFPPES